MLTALALAGALLAPDTRIVVTLNDGSTVLGTTKVKAVKVSAEWGTATVRLAKTRAVTFGKAPSVETADGTVLRGTLDLARLDVRTADGARVLKVADVASFQVVVRAPRTPEQITEGVAENGVTYCLRVPKGYDASKPWPTILVLHGSNMNTNAYVNTIAQVWPKLAQEYVLLGINGENRSRASSPGDPRYNYTYINWVGPRSTMRGTRENESPKYVMEVLKEIQGFVPMSRLFVGGHSQGGYLTYVLFMHFPEAFDGAFPMSGGMIFQAAPDAFEQMAIRKAQRSRPLAIVHGQRDGAVDFSMSEYAEKAFVDDGFGLVRLFAPADVGHSFAHLPVDQVIRWLEVYSGRDVDRILKHGHAAADAKDWRDAVAAANRARSLSKDTAPDALVSLFAKIDAACAGQATELAKAVGKAGNNSWVEPFLRFRAQFAFADAARPCMAAYAALRTAHAKKGDELYYAARRDFNRRKRDEAYAKCQEIVDKYYASRWYTTVKGWLDNRK